MAKSFDTIFRRIKSSHEAQKKGRIASRYFTESFTTSSAHTYALDGSNSQKFQRITHSLLPLIIILQANVIHRSWFGRLPYQTKIQGLGQFAWSALHTAHL